MKMITSFLFYLFVLITGQSQTSANKIDALVNAYYSAKKFNGSVLVAAGDKIILEKGYGFKDFKTSKPTDANTLYQIASTTKTFTAALILELSERKKLSLQDKLSRYYPQLPESSSVSIEQLLSHTSGLSDKSPDTTDNLYTGSEEPAFISALQKRPMAFVPGTSFEYCNANYIVLGYIIQQVTGISYYDAVRKYLFAPAGITVSGFDFTHLISVDRAVGYWSFPETNSVQPATLIDSSAPRAAGAIYSNVQDLYRWHKALQSGKIVSRALLEKAYTPQANKYGYGWVIDTINGKKTVSHGGDIWGFQSMLFRVPEDNFCIVLLSNIEDAKLQHLARKIFAAYHALPYTLPARDSIRLTTEELAKYVGRYQMQAGMVIEVSAEGDHIYMKTGVEQRLYTAAPGQFIIDNGMDQKRITFERDGSGQIVALSFEKNNERVMCIKQ